MNKCLQKIIRFVNRYYWLSKTSLNRRDNKVIIFGAWFGNKYDDNPKYMFEYVCAFRRDLEAYWITPNVDVFNKIKKLGLPVLLSSSEKAKKIAKKAKYLVVSNNIVGGECGYELSKYLGGITMINTWHGVPLKKIMYDDNITKDKNRPFLSMISDTLDAIFIRNIYHICTSENFKNIYSSCFRAKPNMILDLGQARNDYFYYSHENPVKRQFGAKKIILYMPTHRREGAVSLDIPNHIDLNSIEELCEKTNSVFLIKKHFYHNNELLDLKDFNNIIDITSSTYETQVLLDSCEVLVTDYSSCYIDHLLLDRPQVFFAYDLEEYQMEDREMYFEYSETIAGPICRDSNSLYFELNKCLHGIDQYHDKRVKLKNFFYGIDNQSLVSPKQIETIIKL